MDALLRRRMMMQGGGKPVPAPDYVQDGLVLHLDAKRRGGTAGVWTSLVGNHAFTNYGAVFNDDHVYFDGVDDYMKNTSFSPPTVGVGTIEVVYEADSGKYKKTAMVIFAGKTDGGFCYYLSSAGNIYWSIGKTSKPTYATTQAKASVSVSSARAMENNVAMTSASSNYLGNRDSNNYLGKRSSGNFFGGKIYAIRIYNRQLTADEIANNYAIDVSHYNL